MSDAKSDLLSRAKKDGIEFFFAMFVDMHGKPCAKMVPVEAFDVLMGGGAGFAGFAAGPMGQSPAHPDMVAVPDPESYTVVPWQPELAVLQCDIAVEGEPWPYSPRIILKRMMSRVAERARLQRGLRGRVLARTPAPRRRHCGRGPARPLRHALL